MFCLYICILCTEWCLKCISYHASKLEKSLKATGLGNWIMQYNMKRKPEKTYSKYRAQTSYSGRSIVISATSVTALGLPPSHVLH